LTRLVLPTLLLAGLLLTTLMLLTGFVLTAALLRIAFLWVPLVLLVALRIVLLLIRHVGLLRLVLGTVTNPQAVGTTHGTNPSSRCGRADPAQQIEIASQTPPIIVCAVAAPVSPC
jgi:hypothetical protein